MLFPLSHQFCARALLVISFSSASVFFGCSGSRSMSESKSNINIVPVDSGWANNSVNTAIFRKNSLASFGDTQFISFYNKDGFVVLGKRRLGSSKWELRTTAFKGNVKDAHNVISIMVDGDGYLHIAWDHHNNPLHYARSKSPGSLDMDATVVMIGQQESRLSYPEFYKLTNGNLLFFYRDGGSGNGNLVLNQYDIHSRQWTNLYSNLIDGEKQRSAYWQACTDEKGTIHLSWVWRETPDVASNHDLCYARSTDGGKTWEKSNGEKYELPIKESTAEIAQRIPQQSELINQTSMYADASGNAYIATYWREQGATVPQYHLVFKSGDNWETQSIDFRNTPFSLSGAGTKRIPISRPQIVAWQTGNRLAAAVIFRDEERGSKVSVAINKDLSKGEWVVRDLFSSSVGSWEPTYDTELWKTRGWLQLFVQKVEQVDSEGSANIPPQMVYVLECDPKKF